MARKSSRAAPILHRDDPAMDPLQGHVKVTRADWLNAARDVLVNDGVDSVKILTLATRLEVSRSSFYWYFGSRAELLAALLDDWQARNTRSIFDHCEMPSRSANHGLCNFFLCFIEGGQFDPRLDFAVREWARRDKDVRAAIDKADATRLAAVLGVFLRHGYGQAEAETRARVVYFMQLGYHALDVREDMTTRMSRAAMHLMVFTGQPCTPDELAGLLAHADTA